MELDNYWAMKALFAAQDWEQSQKALVKAYRQREWALADVLQSEHDRLAKQVREYDRKARMSLRKGEL